MGQKPSSEAVYRHRLISLPEDIILEIISRVGLPREVVITFSNTNFSIKQTSAPTYDLYEFWTALNNLFTVLIPPIIDTFCLDLNIAHYREPRCWPIIDAWACRLRACNIQHFTATKFSRNSSYDHEYPLSIFRMHSLISLDLNMCHRIAPASSFHFIILPNLKKLRLSWINYECLRWLLSCCPSLEDLSVSINESNTHLKSLTSKKLKRLCISLDGMSIIDVVIDAPILDELNYSTISTLSMQMLDSVSNVVKSLKLDAYTTTISRGPKKTMIFPNLTHLELVGCLPLIIEAIGLMLHCPKLEVFVLRLIVFNNWNQEAILFVPVEHVKRIKLYTSTIIDQFGKEMVDLVTLLLRSAKVLEKLTLCGGHSCSNYLNRPQFYQTLFECVEATSRCQVELLGVYELTS